MTIEEQPVMFRLEGCIERANEHQMVPITIDLQPLVDYLQKDFDFATRNNSAPTLTFTTKIPLQEQPRDYITSRYSFVVSFNNYFYVFNHASVSKSKSIRTKIFTYQLTGYYATRL